MTQTHEDKAREIVKTRLCGDTICEFVDGRSCGCFIAVSEALLAAEQRGIERALAEAEAPELECCGSPQQYSHDEPPMCCGSPEPRHRDAGEIIAAIKALRSLSPKAEG